jgi:hypothetical protein
MFLVRHWRTASLAARLYPAIAHEEALPEKSLHERKRRAPHRLAPPAPQAALTPRADFFREVQKFSSFSKGNS